MLRVDSSNCLKNGGEHLFEKWLSELWVTQALADGDTGRLCAETEVKTVCGCPSPASVESRGEKDNGPHGEVEEVWEGMRAR